MSETYRVPKIVLEEGIKNPAMTLEEVVQLRDSWEGPEGREWAMNICKNITRDALIVSQKYKETNMAAADMETPDLAEELKELLADVVSFYFKAHGAHWNVMGTDFSEYHGLFEEIYSDAYLSIDPIAENIRKLGKPAPFQLAAFAAISEIPQDLAIITDARALAMDILSANDMIIEELSEVFTCATMHNQQGIANFLADRIDSHQRWKWQLSSSLGVDVVNPDPEVMPESPMEEVNEPAIDWIAPETMARGSETSENVEITSEEITVIEDRKTAMASAERITMHAEVRAVDTEDGSLKVGGYAATFNQEATGLQFREVIAQGAFTRTLQTDNPVFLLVNHNMDDLPLASTQSGTLRLAQDKVGLYMEASLDPANPRAQELASAVRRGDVDKMSFAFTVAQDGETREEGLRTLTDLDLYEVSVVTWPAYDSTTVGMRSAQDQDLEIKKQKLALKVKQYSLRSKRKG